MWDSPLESNWVVVTPGDEGKVRILVGDYFAEVLPSNIADLSGSFAYGTTIASSFLGHGSDGAISALLADMQVNFDTGLITEGNLQVQAGNQTWAVNFEGALAAGSVTLNAISGALSSDFGVLSDQLNTSLDGVFTGGQADAFIGGFDIIDTLNPANQVQGLFTIERQP